MESLIFRRYIALSKIKIHFHINSTSKVETCGPVCAEEKNSQLTQSMTEISLSSPLKQRDLMLDSACEAFEDDELTEIR